MNIMRETTLRPPPAGTVSRRVIAPMRNAFAGAEARREHEGDESDSEADRHAPVRRMSVPMSGSTSEFTSIKRCRP